MGCWMPTVRHGSFMPWVKITLLTSGLSPPNITLTRSEFNWLIWTLRGKWKNMVNFHLLPKTFRVILQVSENSFTGGNGEVQWEQSSKRMSKTVGCVMPSQLDAHLVGDLTHSRFNCYSVQIGLTIFLNEMIEIDWNTFVIEQIVQNLGNTFSIAGILIGRDQLAHIVDVNNPGKNAFF